MIENKIKKISVGLMAIAAFQCSFSVCAASANLPAKDDAWQFDIIPYVWLINMNGRVGVADRTAHLDQDFSDIFQKLNYAGMLWLDAHKGNVGLFVNALYAQLSDNVSDGPFSVDATNDYGIFSAGASYDAYKTCFSYSCGGATHMMEVMPYAGFRYTVNNTTVKFSSPIFNESKSDNQNWTDPILGARLKYTFTKSWQVMLAGDLGGTNRSSDYSYNAQGLIGYTPTSFWTNTTTYLGYRLLYQHYTTGSGDSFYDWSMKIFGPVAGFAISF